jgi:dimethylargininase
VLVAVTREVSPALARCALTHVERRPIDIELARQQHRAYEEWLEQAGARVISLPAEPELPDSVFVEDTAVVVDEVAVMTRPLLDSRQREVASVASALADYRPVHSLSAPAHLEGGDVLRVGRTLYVGISTRTNEAGIDMLRAAVEPFGYQVRSVIFSGCLHLKSACTYAGRETLLVNRAYLDPAQLGDFEVLDVPEGEPGENVLLIGETVLVPANAPRTIALLEERGFAVMTVDVSELQKAEAALTCCSILFSTDRSGISHPAPTPRAGRERSDPSPV